MARSDRRVPDPRPLVAHVVFRFDVGGLENGVANLIERGALRPGDRLPSVRTYARERRVSVATVLSAYLDLENRGLVEAKAKPAKEAKPGKEARKAARRERRMTAKKAAKSA